MLQSRFARYETCCKVTYVDDLEFNRSWRTMMQNRFGKLLSAALAVVVLAMSFGCSDGKSPPRKADETNQTPPPAKPGQERR